jgi:MFS family permease
MSEASTVPRLDPAVLKLSAVVVTGAITVMLDMTIGPLLGGLIVDSLSWRWIFYLNVPVSLLALLLSHRVIADNGQREVRRLDLPGLALLSPAIALLVYGLWRPNTRPRFRHLTTFQCCAVARRHRAGSSRPCAIIWHHFADLPSLRCGRLARHRSLCRAPGRLARC